MSGTKAYQKGWCLEQFIKGAELKRRRRGGRMAWVVIYHGLSHVSAVRWNAKSQEIKTK